MMGGIWVASVNLNWSRMTVQVMSIPVADKTVDQVRSKLSKGLIELDTLNL